MERYVYSARPLRSCWIVSLNCYMVALNPFHVFVFYLAFSWLFGDFRELKIIREGVDYYLIRRGEIRRHFGSRRQRKGQEASTLSRPGELTQDGSLVRGSSYGILERMLFFIGDLEVASNEAKRSRLMWINWCVCNPLLSTKICM